MEIRRPNTWNSGEAFQRYSQLTMPPGALDGVFVPLLRLLAQREKPFSERLKGVALVFAGDHQVVVDEGVSAFPQVVTAQMVCNFVAGGAAMSVLCRQRGASLHVVDVGVATPYDAPNFCPPGISFHNRNLARHRDGYGQGARNLARTAAMDEATFELAFGTGFELAQSVIAAEKPDYLIVGEMGIGNTTPATAVTCAVVGSTPAELVGGGTGISSSGKSRKAEVVQRALERHAREFGEQGARPATIMRSLGGFELAAMAGAALAAAENRVHILVDGVIATAAILPWAAQMELFREWLIAGHRSAEPSHHAALAKLGLSPMLDLGMRLGEGSGAAMAAGLLHDAHRLLNEMATFESAEVSGKEG